MIEPTQMHRLDGAIATSIAEIRRDMELHAASVCCRRQLAPVGLDQQGQHETRDPFRGAFCDSDTLLPDDTDGFGFEAAYVRPIGRAERVMLRIIEQATPIRVALAVTYLAALSVVAGVVWGGWQ